MGYAPDHKRMKRKASDKPTAAEKLHMDRVAGLPCLASGKHPVTLHHVTSTVDGGRITRSHSLVVPLAPEYHLIQHGPHTSVEALGHGGFFEKWGIDLLEEARILRLESVYLGIRLTNGA
jgi:hypothetical protein